MFFLFPDPHFKRSKHKARIITYVAASLSLRPQTDVAFVERHCWLNTHTFWHPEGSSTPSRMSKVRPCPPLSTFTDTFSQTSTTG